MDQHFINEKLEAGIIKLPFVRSKDLLADILTKVMHIILFNEVLSKVCIRYPTTQLEGGPRVREENILGSAVDHLQDMIEADLDIIRVVDG